MKSIANKVQLHRRPFPDVKTVHKSPGEATLYVKMTGELIIVSIYVDDLFVPGSNEKLMMEFKGKMLQMSEMTDLGLMSFFLGMKIKQEKYGVLICQKNMQKKLKKFYMENCKSIDTPMNQHEKLSRDNGAER